MKPKRTHAMESKIKNLAVHRRDRLTVDFKYL